MEFLKRSTNGRANRRPRLMLGGQALPVLEPRVVPTVIFGPVNNPQFGVTTKFVEFLGTMTAQITQVSGATPVTGAYESFTNATAGTTSGGLHNNANQHFLLGLPFVTIPGQTISVPLAETGRGRTEGQATGTQFDVLLNPPSDPLGTPTLLTAGIIAYNPLIPASNTTTLDFAAPPVPAGVNPTPPALGMDVDLDLAVDVDES